MDGCVCVGQCTLVHMPFGIHRACVSQLLFGLIGWRLPANGMSLASTVGDTGHRNILSQYCSADDMMLRRAGQRCLLGPRAVSSADAATAARPLKRPRRHLLQGDCWLLPWVALESHHGYCRRRRASLVRLYRLPRILPVSFAIMIALALETSAWEKGPSSS